MENGLGFVALPYFLEKPEQLAMWLELLEQAGDGNSPSQGWIVSYS